MEKGFTVSSVFRILLKASCFFLLTVVRKDSDVERCGREKRGMTVWEFWFKELNSTFYMSVLQFRIIM